MFPSEISLYLQFQYTTSPLGQHKVLIMRLPRFTAPMQCSQRSYMGSPSSFDAYMCIFSSALSDPPWRIQESRILSLSHLGLAPFPHGAKASQNSTNSKKKKKKKKQIARSQTAGA